MPAFTNKLIHETSPYLLQHAHNPVDWYPWGEEALQKAKEEDKPILVSIGYSACHWCHVMEKESFENEATAEIMNSHFINIKIDREERPDLDHIYMDAIQAMTGSGGWPLNVFLTPHAKPFYGGTYFPPVKVHNRPSWKEVLYGVSQAFKEKRNDIEEQAEQLTEHIHQSNSFGLKTTSAVNIPFEERFIPQQAHLMFDNIMKAADTTWGGFGRAPKFPQTFTIQYLLRYHHFYKEEKALQQACLSIDKMIQGGIYDQLGGGFARYSTDTEWLAPHFEKMLYDNALLVSVLCEAYQLTKKESYANVIRDTISFVQRELMNNEKGFYSALDADSEGEEGKYYVWSKHEIEDILGEDAELFRMYYDVTANGNWEGSNILRTLIPLYEFAEKHQLNLNDAEQKLKSCRHRLIAEREKRTRPQLDDKILLGWNALMNTACSKAYAALGEEQYKTLAEQNMQFLLERFEDRESGAFFHTFKKTVRYPAFLDDYAYIIQALLSLHEISGTSYYLKKASDLAEFVIVNFSEENTGYFFYTHQAQQDVIVRKKEVYDGAVPSGNAIMAHNLHQLGILLDRTDWRERAVGITEALSHAIIKYPTSFGAWANFLIELIVGTNEIAVVGKDSHGLAKKLLNFFIPNKVLQFAAKPADEFPLLSGKSVPEGTEIFLCRRYACKKPVKTAEDFLQLLDQ
jgi:uncharacterized protein